MRWSVILLPALLWGEAGVLIPTGVNQPDASRLALAEMEIRIRIDNQHAVVDTRQIFANRDGRTVEGTYTFTLPGSALVSDFAVWDDVTRIPGVILERRRAEEIYNVARAQAIDPGILQQGERDVDEARRTSVFSAHIAPIPAWGTKRVEMQYQERLPVENFESFFAVPLRPDAYRAMTAGHLSIQLEITSTHPIADFVQVSKAYPLQVREKTPNRIRADFSGDNVTFSEDFAVKYRLDAARSDTVSIVAYRAGANAPGYFEASVLLGHRGSPVTANAPARTVIVLFDNSLSMQWEKLERSFLALERLLRSLTPHDQFEVVLFNSEVGTSTPRPVPAGPATVEAALAFVRNSQLRGGTDLQRVLRAALAHVAGETSIVLLTDGNSTQGATIRNARISAWYAGEIAKLGARRPRTNVFAVGDDANAALLRRLVGDNGVFEWVRSTEPADFKLNAFLSKLVSRPVERLSLTTTPAGNTDLVYPLQDSSFGGSTASWVGQYKRAKTSFTISGVRDGSPLKVTAAANLPAQDTAHVQLPRTWAKARVDALLDKIDREGEDSATIDEIIRLAREFKFVTPYTSFLAAPRSLLRPRLIRPGDPVLRVHTDESIVSVVAIFPFGLVKPLRYLKDEDVWQTRFLAPTDLPDGTHPVRLILRDRQGRAFRESKTFIIASKPPQVRATLDRSRVRRGENVRLRVQASQTSRTIVARMYGTAPVVLRWSAAQSASVGELPVPAYLPAGVYPIEVTAEDFAHNVGRQEVKLEVLP